MASYVKCWLLKDHGNKKQGSTCRYDSVKAAGYEAMGIVSLTKPEGLDKPRKKRTKKVEYDG